MVGSRNGFLFGEGRGCGCWRIFAPPLRGSAVCPPSPPPPCAALCTPIAWRGGGAQNAWGCAWSAVGGGRFSPPRASVSHGGGSLLPVPPPSWPTPSACCWSTPGRPMRTNCTAAGKVRGGAAGGPPHGPPPHPPSVLFGYGGAPHPTALWVLGGDSVVGPPPTPRKPRSVCVGGGCMAEPPQLVCFGGGHRGVTPFCPRSPRL